MSNQVEKATTVVQSYVSPSERQVIQQAVNMANERSQGRRAYSESEWSREQLVRAARRMVGRSVSN